MSDDAAFIKEVSDVWAATSGEGDIWVLKLRDVARNIERLEAENAKLKSALGRINNCAAAHEYDAKAMREIARAALEGK